MGEEDQRGQRFVPGQRVEQVLTPFDPRRHEGAIGRHGWDGSPAERCGLTGHPLFPQSMGIMTSGVHLFGGVSLVQESRG